MRKLGYLVLGSLVAAGCGVEGDSTDSSGQASQAMARVYIGFQPGQAAEAKAAAMSAGGQLHHEFDQLSAFVVSVPVAALAGLESNPHVRYIEDDVLRYPQAQTTPYGIPMVQADQVLGPTTANSKTICIIDSGYGLGHEDLQSSNVTGTNTSGTGNWYDDTCGHGSHVAGTIAAVSNDVGVVGVISNGNAKLHIVKVFDGEACGWAYSSTLLSALNLCRAAGANVISMSLGGGSSSLTENNAFADAYAAGVLSIAAAGNDGTTSGSVDPVSYPAGYASVISVAAIDATRTHATFSQENSDVELAAPGVAVESTVPYREDNTLAVGGRTFLGNHIEGAARSSGTTGPLVDGGLCDATGAYTGKVVVCRRGTVSFADKVTNVKNSGGIAAVIYNNSAGSFVGTLGVNVTSTIPAISLSDSDGAVALASAGQSATVVSRRVVSTSSYEAWDGTSMATPHVAGVAALVWSNFPTATNVQIRNALTSTALDLGTAGRDISTGYGLVQAASAFNAVAAGGGGGGGDTTPPVISNVTSQKKKSGAFSIQWSTNEASSSTVRFTGTGAGTFSNATLVTSHSMSFRGTRGVTYTYYVSSTDAAANTTELGPYTHRN